MQSPGSLRLDISRFFQSPLNIALAGHIPRKFCRLYFIFCGLAYLALRKDMRRRISNGTRSVLRSNIGIINQLRLKRAVYLGLVDHYFEKMWNIYSPMDALCEYVRSNTVIQNRTWLDHSLRDQSGVLLMSVLGYKPAIIARFKTAELLKNSLTRAKLHNIKIINANEPGVFFRAARVLKEGRILITLCDEFSHWIPCAKKTVEVFGAWTSQDKTLDLLHRRVNVPVCLGLMHRNKNGYQLAIHPLSVLPDESLGSLSWRLLEHFILQNPGQWYQWHDVTGALKTYKEKSQQNLKEKPS